MSSNLRAIVFVVVGFGAASVSAQTTQLVSVSSAGGPSNGAIYHACAISSSGDHVVFASYASNLVANDTNNAIDVFLRDRATGVTERISVGSNGEQPNLSSNDPHVTSNGRWVTFASSATNLVAGDDNGCGDVFLRDRLTGTTTRISVSSSGAQGHLDAWSNAIAANGGFVAFTSFAMNMVAGDTNHCADVFVRDLATATNTRVSVDSLGVQSNGDSTYCSISSDGRYVVFASDATNLVSGDTNGYGDVFVHDRQSATTTRVNVDSAGVQANFPTCFGSSESPSISLDGRYVAFSSWASNLAAGDTNGFFDIFVHDRQTGLTTRVSTSYSGGETDSSSYSPCLSADGRYVGYLSGATNIVAGDLNGHTDVFVHDRATGLTTRASVDSAGAASNANSGLSSISADGRSIAFDSLATNLVSGDTNNQSDIFVRDRWPPVPSVYCTSGTSSTGCQPSIAANAEPNVAHSTPCQITVSGVNGQRTGIVFYALAASIEPWCSMGGGTSYLCVKPPTQRTGAQASGGTLGLCDGSLALNWNAFQLANPSSLGNVWSVGTRVFVQGWFRDPTSCKTTSLSDAVELRYQP